MAHPNDPEFIECMAALIWKGLKNRRWLSRVQNIYIPYYTAHIIGSYTMNMEEFAESANHAGVVSPLVELLRGRLTWVEQRVAVRALGHLATYASTFPAIASHGEILELSIQLATSCLEIVYSHFYQYVDRKLSYHCDLLTRGMGGVEMESRKAEEWASQLQCWSLELINCLAFKPEFLPTICKPEFSRGQCRFYWTSPRFQFLGITKLGDSMINVLPECVVNFASAAGCSSLSDHIKEQIEEILGARQRLKLEKNLPKQLSFSEL